MSIINDYAGLAAELVRYSRLCYDRRLVGAAGGNLSVRVPGRKVFFVTASGVSLRDVAPGNLVVVDGSGKVLEGPPGAKPSKETGFHLVAYKMRPAVSAIIHVHPPYVTAFSTRRQTIPTVTISAQLKLKQGPVVPRAAPGSQELKDFVVEALEGSPPEATVLLMEAHGLMTMRPTLCEAFDDAELAEDTAKIAMLDEPLFPPALPGFAGVQLVDLTAPLNERIPCYPTDPRFAKHWHVDFAKHGAYVSKLEMGAHTGTHVDAPMHFLGDQGLDVTSVSLDRFLGEAMALDAPKNPGENVMPSDVRGADIRAGDIVLFRTGWEKRAGTPAFFEGQWPGFHPQLMKELIGRGVKAVGGDVASADSPAAIAAGAPAHKLAARAEMPVFEALVNMDQVVSRRFQFIGFPLKLDSGEASPIRAIALLDHRISHGPTS